MSTGAVVVAAGLSSRMGDFKPMLRMGALSIAQRVIVNFQQADCYPVVVVTGYRADELEKHLSKLGVLCVRNRDYGSTEMFDSAKIGFSFIRDKCDRTFFTPVDVPLFSLATVKRMLDSEADIVMPVCGGETGHPILLSAAALDRVLSYQGTGGLKDALRQASGEVGLIEVDDEGILRDADTQEDYSSLVNKRKQELFRPVLDISLMREGKLFDRNAGMLMSMIDSCGTVKDACEKVGMSYSRAWKLIAQIEENLGFALIERQPGGESGGASVLTGEGKDLLRRYRSYTDDVKKYANSIFGDYFEK